MHRHTSNHFILIFMLFFILFLYSWILRFITYSYFRLMNVCRILFSGKQFSIFGPRVWDWIWIHSSLFWIARCQFIIGKNCGYLFCCTVKQLFWYLGCMLTKVWWMEIIEFLIHHYDYQQYQTSTIIIIFTIQ